LLSYLRQSPTKFTNAQVGLDSFASLRERERCDHLATSNV